MQRQKKKFKKQCDVLGGGDSLQNCWPGKAFLRRWYLNRDLRGKMDPATWRSVGGHCQTEECSCSNCELFLSWWNCHYIRAQFDDFVGWALFRYDFPEVRRCVRPSWLVLDKFPRRGARGIIAFDPVPLQNCLKRCSETLDIAVPGGDNILQHIQF